MQIVAALGPSSRAPLLAEGGGVRAVLHRVPPASLSAVDSPYVWPCTGTVDVDGRARGVFAHHPGADLSQLVERHPEGLPAPWATAIAGDLLAAVDALAAHGLAPVCREESLRVGVDGVARVIEVREGAEGRQELADLLERLVEPAAAEGLAAEIAAGRVAPGQGTRHAAPAVEPRYATPLRLGAPKDTGAPPKLVVARIGVLLLALGLAVGWMLAPRGAPAVQVAVPGATEVSLACGGTVCTVSASFADGRASGRVDASSARSYSCTRTDGSLECTASSP